MTQDLRVALYLRLSVSRDESTSITRQEEDLRALAAREGWRIVAVLSDDGLSGGSRRAKADAALDMLRRDEADVIAVFKFDRWSRQGARAVADLQDVLDARRKARRPALFVALQDGLRSDTPTWDIQVALIAAMGRAERETIRSRVAHSRAYLRAQHRFSGGVPYGYRAVPHPSGSGRALDIDPEQAKLVRFAAECVLSGMTTYATAKLMNEQGLRPRRAEKWAAGSVSDMLQRDSLLGYMTHRAPGDSTRTRRPILGDDGLPVQVWPAVLTKDEAARLRALLVSSPGSWGATAATAGKRASRLLSGKLLCGTCGAIMRAGQGDKLLDGSVSHRYVCSAPTGACPAKVSINARLVEEHVTETFLNVVGHMELVEVRQTAPASGDLAEVEAAIRATTSEMASPTADIGALVDRLNALRTRREEMAHLPTEPTIEHVATGQTFAEAWQARTVHERRALLAQHLVGAIGVRKAVRGYRGMDASRLSIAWTWEEPDVGAEVEAAGRDD